MSRVSLPLAMLATVIACGQVFPQELHLKTRDVYTGTPARGQSRALLRGTIEAGHRILQFDHSPGVEDIEALLAAGFQVIAAIPDNALVVTGPRTIPPQIEGLRWVGALDIQDKLSPELDLSGSTVTAIVEFHADIEPALQESAASAEHLTLNRPAPLLPYDAVVTAAPETLRALASHDEVAYIFPADPSLLAGESPGNTLMACAGMLTLSGPIAQYANIVRGWDLDSDGKAHLGYAFGELTSKLAATSVESEIVRAMNAWSAVANVTFQPATSLTAARTVALEFASGAHGDAYPFDTAGTLIAHTFYPVPVNSESIAGDVHLNAVENWHVGGDIDVYTVVLHELGHAIGLAHSDNPGDVMYPYYRRGMQLSANDIGAARALYGAPAGSPASDSGTPAPITTPPANSIPLSLTLNPIPPPGQAAQTPLSGTVSGGVPPLSLQYQTDHGYSGNIDAPSSGAWSVAAIPLVTGTNTLTVTAFDSAHQAASQSAVVTRMATSATTGATPIRVSITSPAAAVTTSKNATLSVAGTASGGTGITQVTWQTSNGASGTATGATQWLASNVPLFTGTNTIMIRAWDATGASAWASVVAVRP